MIEVGKSFCNFSERKAPSEIIVKDCPRPVYSRINTSTVLPDDYIDHIAL